MFNFARQQITSKLQNLEQNENNNEMSQMITMDVTFGPPPPGHLKWTYAKFGIHFLTNSIGPLGSSPFQIKYYK